MSAVRVLIVDDELHIRRLLKATLERAGYEALEAADARAALAAVAAVQPQAVLLDLGLPDRDGLELVSLIGKAGPAVIVVSAREMTDDKVAALDLGADDYVTKPFDTDELLARLRAALRHKLADQGVPPRLAAGGVEIDLLDRRVRRDGEDIRLTRKEYDVLATLAAAPGRVVTHGAIMKAAWPREHEHHIEYLRIVIRNLRQKIEPDPAAPTIVRNELGIGYRLMVEG